MFDDNMFTEVEGLTDATEINTVKVNQIDGLLELAKNRVGQRDALQQWINKNVKDLPLIPNSEGKAFLINREYNKVRQSVSDSLWIITMLSIQQQGYTSVALLSAVTKTSINESAVRREGENLYVPLSTTQNSWKKTSVWMLGTLVKLGMVETKQQDMENRGTQTLYYIDANWSKAHLNPIIEEMREKVSIVCKPLDFAPCNWIEGEQTQKRTKLKLVSRKSNTLVEYRASTLALAPLNTLQRVGYEVAKGHEADIFDCLDKEVDQVKRDSFTELLKLQEKDAFYFPVSCDYRFRMYYRGGTIHPQAQKEVRQFLNFAQGEVVNRLDAIQDLTHALEDRENPVQRVELERLKGLCTERVMCKVVVNFDGVANGLQHQSMLLRSSKLAKLTKLIESDMEEVYLHVVSCIIAAGIKVTRKFLKNVIMTASYGATKRTQMEDLRKELTPKDAEIVYEIINTELPELKKYTQFITSRCNMFANDNCNMSTPDGFEMRFRKVDRTESTLFAGKFSAITGTSYQEDAEATARATAPNSIHMHDAYHLRLVVGAWVGNISTIHDSVGVVAGRGKELQKLILAKFVEVHTEDILNNWANANNVAQLKTKGSLRLSDVDNINMFN